MSSLIKKKGALSFKPKAPARRAAGPPPISSTRPSTERQSQTPAPTVVRSTALSPPPPLVGAPSKPIEDEPLSQELQDPAPIETAPEVLPVTASHNTDAAALVTTDADIVTTGDSQDQIRRSPIIEQIPQPVPSASDEAPQLNIGEQLTGPSPILEEVLFVEAESVHLQPPPPPPQPENQSVATAVDLSALGAGQTNRITQLVPVAPLNPDGTSGEPIAPGLQADGKRPPKRRRLNDNKEVDTEGADIRPTIEVQINKPRRVTKPRIPRNPNDPPRQRKKRAETPEDAEEQEVDHTTTKMADLCKDLKIGKKFSKHDEIKKREHEKRLKRKLAKQNPELVEHREEGEVVQSGNLEVASGPQMRIVDGQIVIDDASLVVDRHRGIVEAATDMEVIVEDEFSKVVTSGTHMKRESNLYWTNADTAKFYNGLRMFGTDFEMISKMFPERNRRQVKLKFNKEEREHPKRLNAALIGEKVPIDMDEYKSHTGLEYEEVSVIMNEHRAAEEEHEAEQRRLEDAAAESTRQKKADIQNHGALAARPSGNAPTAGTESSKENDAGMDGGRTMITRGKKKLPAKKKKRNLHSTKGGGEEVEVLGTINGA